MTDFAKFKRLMAEGFELEELVAEVTGLVKIVLRSPTGGTAEMSTSDIDLICCVMTMSEQ